jgi:3-deoxy-D-manno-octulosonic-acid transferase
MSGKMVQTHRAEIPWQVRLYRASTLVLSPFILLHMIRRRITGHEKNLFARFGLSWLTQQPREKGTRLVWIHGASIGESLAALTLSQLLARADPSLRFLITSGTVTGVSVLSTRVSARPEENQSVVATIQAPLDLLYSVRKFLWAWQPDAFIGIESEIWPNIIWECRTRGIKLLLVDARMSARSEQRWHCFSALKSFISSTLEQFSLVLCQSPADALRLKNLGAREPVCIGSVKASAGPPIIDPHRQKSIQKSMSGQRIWLAASTHPGEEEIVTDAHAFIVDKWREIRAAERPPCLVLIPRHPERSRSLVQSIQARYPEWMVALQETAEDVVVWSMNAECYPMREATDHVSVGKQTDGGVLSKHTDTRDAMVMRNTNNKQEYAAKKASDHVTITEQMAAVPMTSHDSESRVSCRRPRVIVAGYLGATTLWMSEADLCFVGGSLVPHIGGHNVVEPALLKCAVLHGKYMHNARHLIEGLLQRDKDSVTCVGGAGELGTVLLRLLLQDGERDARARAAYFAAVKLGDDVRGGIVERVLRAL